MHFEFEFTPYTILIEHIINAPHTDQLIIEALINLARQSHPNAQTKELKAFLMCHGHSLPANAIEHLRLNILPLIRANDQQEFTARDIASATLQTILVQTTLDANECIVILQKFNLIENTIARPQWVINICTQWISQEFQSLRTPLIETVSTLIRRANQLNINIKQLRNQTTGQTLLHYIAYANDHDPRSTLQECVSHRTVLIDTLEQYHGITNWCFPFCRATPNVHTDYAGNTPFAIAEARRSLPVTWKFFKQGLYTRSDLRTSTYIHSRIQADAKRCGCTPFALLVLGTALWVIVTSKT